MEWGILESPWLSVCPSVQTQFCRELPLLNHSPFCDQNLLYDNALVAGMITFSDSSSCDRIHCSLTTVRYFENGDEGKQPVALKEHCAEYWLKELQESMDRCTGRRDITEILLKTALNTIQSINKCSIINLCQKNPIQCH